MIKTTLDKQTKKMVIDFKNMDDDIFYNKYLQHMNTDEVYDFIKTFPKILDDASLHLPQ